MQRSQSRPWLHWSGRGAAGIEAVASNARLPRQVSEAGRKVERGSLNDSATRQLNHRWRLSDAPSWTFRRQDVAGRDRVRALLRPVGDQARPPAVYHEADRPSDHDDDAVLEPDELPQMDDKPQNPCGQSTQLEPLDLGDGPRTSDRGQVPLSR